MIHVWIFTSSERLKGVKEAVVGRMVVVGGGGWTSGCVVRERGGQERDEQLKFQQYETMVGHTGNTQLLASCTLHQAPIQVIQCRFLFKSVARKSVSRRGVENHAHTAIVKVEAEVNDFDDGVEVHGTSFHFRHTQILGEVQACRVSKGTGTLAVRLPSFLESSARARRGARRRVPKSGQGQQGGECVHRAEAARASPA